MFEKLKQEKRLLEEAETKFRALQRKLEEQTRKAGEQQVRNAPPR